MHTLRSRQAGVTLVELMTVVVVIAVLAGIAIPSYRAYLLRANRSDAKASLLQLQAAQEKFYLSNSAYTTKVKDAPPAGLGMTDITQHGYYQLTVVSDGQSYTATAAPIAGAGQSDDNACGSFSLTDTGVRTVSAPGANTQTCWK
jgi:type IV pilus assembly protein PilE